MRELVFSRLLRAQVEEGPDRTLVVDPAGGYAGTYAGQLTRVLRLSAALRGLGVARQQRFAVLSRNSHRYLELWHAALFGQGVIVPLNVRLAAAELVTVLRDCEATACFADAEFLVTARAVAAQAGVRHVVALDDPAAYEALIATSAEVMPDEPRESDAVAIMYTGGTTGMPKGAILSQQALLLNQYHVLMVAPVARGWTFLQHAAMFHAGAGASIMRFPICGGTVVLMPAFDAGRFIETVDAHHVDCTVLVPSMISMILDHPEFRPERLRSLRRVAYGGAPISGALVRRLRETLPELELHQAYGMTEACSNVSHLGDEDHRSGDTYLGSVGRALPGVEVTVRDPVTGKTVPRGSVGEICVRGGNVMTGYWNRPGETAAALHGGVYRTGDLGFLDPDGYLFLVDRLKDMIVSGGENVYSAEVEQALASHPGVGEVAVIGVADDTWGEAVVAIVVPAAEARTSERELIAHARQSIAGYKVPKRILLRAEPLPLSAAGKVLKRLLRDEYRQLPASA